MKKMTLVETAELLNQTRQGLVDYEEKRMEILEALKKGTDTLVAITNDIRELKALEAKLEVDMSKDRIMTDEQLMGLHDDIRDGISMIVAVDHYEEIIEQRDEVRGLATMLQGALDSLFDSFGEGLTKAKKLHIEFLEKHNPEQAIERAEQ